MFLLSTVDVRIKQHIATNESWFKSDEIKHAKDVTSNYAWHHPIVKDLY